MPNASQATRRLTRRASIHQVMTSPSAPNSANGSRTANTARSEATSSPE